MPRQPVTLACSLSLPSFGHSLNLFVCPRSILPLHSTTSRAELLGWLSIDALKPLAEQGQVDLDAPLSALLRGDAPATTNGQQLAASQSRAAAGEERPVKEFKRGRKYEGAFRSWTHRPLDPPARED